VKINLKDTNSFKPCPDGMFPAVCVDVVDLGLREDTFQGKTKNVHKLRIVWQVDELDETGKRYIVSKTYNLSGHKKSNLRKDLETWRGRPFSTEGLDEFELEDLVGVNCQVSVAHRLMPDGETWTTVQAVVPAAKGAPKMAPKEYVRKKDRPEEGTTSTSKKSAPVEDEGDGEDVPF